MILRKRLRETDYTENRRYRLRPRRAFIPVDDEEFDESDEEVESSDSSEVEWLPGREEEEERQKQLLFSLQTAETEMKELRENLWKSYENGHFDECTLVVEGKEIRIQKIILTSHSEVFSCMFSHAGTSESQSNTVKIKNCTYGAMTAFVEYLHHGEAEKLNEFAGELCILADRYIVPKLRTDCIKSIKESTDFANLFQHLIAAFTHHDEKLKETLMIFMRRNRSSHPFSTLLKTDKWFELMGKNKKMAQEIMDYVFEKLRVNC